MGRRQDPARGRRGGARAVRRAAAGRRRDPRLSGRRERSDDPLLRPLRRPAAGAARSLGVGSLRGDDPRRMAVCARRGRRQGAALDAPARRRAARGRRRPSDQHPDRLGRRGGGRRPVDRRVPGAGRARRRCVRDLRRRHGIARPAGALDCHPRPRGVQHPRPHRPAGSPLRDVRQRRDERDSRA